MMTLHRFRRLEAALRRRGFGPVIEWSENIQPAADADEFADRVVFVICSGGMNATVARRIYERCMGALRAGESATSVFGHPGKAKAIDTVWRAREELHNQYLTSGDKLAYLETLPWVGPVLMQHLAKNLGHPIAKGDVHLVRLAGRDQTTAQRLCQHLARLTGYRVATIDSILWRACADGLLKSATYELNGWSAAISAEVTKEAWLSMMSEPSAPASDSEPDPPPV